MNTSVPDTTRSGAQTLPHHAPSQGQFVGQPYYVYSSKDDGWRETFPARNSTTPNDGVHSFSVLSWNIDFMLPLPQPRMGAALAFLKDRIAKSESPCVVMLQEMLETDLRLIQEQSWVRSAYFMTDICDQFWKSNHYGTCTLISKSLLIASVFRVHYEKTKMERDGLFVDIAFQNNHIIRVCNTHLESLVADPPLRPSQLQTSAVIMHDPKVHASVLGGDLNAIQSFDRTLHLDNDLRDAYLVNGGKEDDENGCTWGQMARTEERKRFGLSRMDKLLFCGNVELISFGTFGYDVQVTAEEDQQMLIREGLEKGWVTDHLGVQGTFRALMED